MQETMTTMTATQTELNKTNIKMDFKKVQETYTHREKHTFIHSES